MAPTSDKQVERSVTIDAPVAAVWEVLTDARLLARWAPAAEEVVSCSAAGEGVGTSRTSTVKLAGRSGTIVERCVECTPTSHIAYVVDDETFGMAKMFVDHGFSFDLESSEPRQTRVTLRTQYTPRNPLYAVLNVVIVRRQFGRVSQGLLNGLKEFTEARAQNPAG